MKNFAVGQRWTSETEPELGLGRIEEADRRLIRVYFPACNEDRRYSSESAPLRRVLFAAGEVLESTRGFSITITEVREKNGLFFYCDETHIIPEQEIHASEGIRGTEARLLAGDFDDSGHFRLRRKVLDHVSRISDSKTAGFVGGRIDLIPHQLFIAHEVSRRIFPRVLLADEVGLGKTIEAALILHRLLRTHKIARVLIIVPDTLVHQWLVELIRRFNLWFQIADQEYCEAAAPDAPAGNPFLAKQLILCGISTLTENMSVAGQAAAAGWDMVVVDEAHHLAWSPEKASPAYDIVSSLTQTAKGVILLTATPEQLGPVGHFARLRLLDPARYRSYEDYLENINKFTETAALGNKLAQSEALTSAEMDSLCSRLGIMRREADKACAENPAAFYERALKDLLDRHGIGRVMFRNTRAVMKNFPQRRAHLDFIEAGFEEVQKIADEQTAEYQQRMPLKEYSLVRDPRILWLDALLTRHRREKFLLICRSLEKAKAVEAALKERRNLKTAVFHEELSLIQRDRQAAWFADPEGARILICSEIGSEGRNFQFAHHLILFDIPYNPEMLEQRIGRLDRIGQKKHIDIHVPCVSGTPGEVWVRWYHEALNAFEQNCPGASVYLEAFDCQLKELFLHPVSPAASDKMIFEKKMKQLISETRKLKEEFSVKLSQGRDRLLELSSYNVAAAQSIIDEMHECDGDFVLEELMELIFDQFGVVVEETDARTYFIRPGDEYSADAFPALPKEGLTITYDRPRAIAHENLHFMTWDHPMTSGAFEMILGSAHGTCAFALLPSDQHGFVLECAYVMECLAPVQLNIAQYLPRSPVCFRVQPGGSLCTNDREPVYPGAAEAQRFRSHLQNMREAGAELLEAAEAQAARILPGLIKDCLSGLEKIHKPEIERLRYLKTVNDAVTEDEILAAEAVYASLAGFIKKARLRLDAVCLMLEVPGEPD